MRKKTLAYPERGGMMTTRWVLIVGLAACAAAIDRAEAQQDLYMMGTTIPREADLWYQQHYRDSLRSEFEIEFADVYDGPSPDAEVLGHLLTVADWDVYLHMSWVYRPAGTGTSMVWREDVGDWGYSINQFVSDTVAGWVQLPPGPYGDSVWVRLIGYDETNGFPGSVRSIEGQLILLDGVPARQFDSGETDTLRSTVLITSIEDGMVTFRPEVPSDMPCGEVIPPDPEVSHYSAPTSAFVTDARQPRFRIAYPKGC